MADSPDPKLRMEYQADYKKAKFAAETAKNKGKANATKMFQFYTNLLSADAKYAWNRIVKEQMEADPFKDLHPRKAHRDFCVSHSTTASCSTSSPCFRTMQLRKKNITFPV